MFADSGDLTPFQKALSVILCDCTCQSEETLEEHFSALNRKYVNGQGTLAVIERLRALPDDRLVYGLTSVDRLCLLSQDDYTTPWWVVLTSHSARDFTVECRMPADQAPWRSAKITGKTEDLSKAVEMLVESLKVSRGWNSEMGDAPIGLDEILEENLSLFRYKDAESELRELLGSWENRLLRCPQSGREVLATVFAQTGEEESLAYRHDAATTSNRWGALPADSDVLPPSEGWYFWLDDAYCRSKAWDGPPPPA